MLCQSVVALGVPNVLQVQPEFILPKIAMQMTNCQEDPQSQTSQKIIGSEPNQKSLSIGQDAFERREVKLNDYLRLDEKHHVEAGQNGCLKVHLQGGKLARHFTSYNRVEALFDCESEKDQGSRTSLTSLSHAFLSCIYLH